MSSLEGPVTAVLRIFDVVVGVALERALKDDGMIRFALRQFRYVRGYRFRRGTKPLHVAYEVIYWSSFLVLVSLALRFAIGSEVQMKHVYGEATLESTLGFMGDLLFLVLFGVVLVRAALSARLTDFLRWLIMFSLLGIIWSCIELARWPGSPYGCWWLGLNSLQLAFTLPCRWMIRRRPRDARYALMALAAVYMTLFAVDVWHLVEMS